MKSTAWYIILNPAAANGRAGRTWLRIAELLSTAEIAYELIETAYRAHAIELVAAGTKKGFHKIMAIGGDGINNEVINGIATQTHLPIDQIIYTLLPLGTGNDWIKTHGIPTDFKKWIPKLKNGRVIRQDIGVLTYHKDGAPKKRYFANVAGLAYDAFLCKEMSQEKNFSNQLGFLWLTIRELFKYKLRKARVCFDDQEIENYFYTINIGICRYSGGGMQLVPHAIPDDGLLALTIAGPISKLGVLLNSWRFYSGSVKGHSQVNCFKTKKIVIDAIGSEPTLVEVDGEFLGETPVRCWILEQQLNVLVP